MKLVVDKKTLELIEANTFLEKLFGLMFKKNINYALRLKCNGIHTFFMREKIDVIVCDKDNNIISVYKCLKKNRVVLPKKKAYYTYELPAGTINEDIKKIEIIN